MDVRIINRTNGGWNIHILEVTISANCPLCGERRGMPRNLSFFENGSWYSCDTWDNPCGHIDKHKNVLMEAHALGHPIIATLRGI